MQDSAQNAGNGGAVGLVAPAAQDGDAQRRMSAQSYAVLADAMPQLVWVTDANGSHFYFNQRWYDYTGLSEAESLGFGFANALHPDDVERTLARWQRAWGAGESYEIEYRFRRHDGVYHWFIGRAMPVRDTSGAIVEWVGTCTDIDEQKRNADTLKFLAEAGSVLSSSLDYETTLAQVVRLAVPHVADWCAVDMVEPDGSMRRLAVAHVDPAKVQLAHRLYEMLPFDPNASSGMAYVVRTGQSELTPTLTDDYLRSIVGEGDLLQLLRDLGLRSSMVVPLIAWGRTLGAITLVSAESGRSFTEHDLRLAEELARRAAVAIDNAQLYVELRQFRTTLDQIHDCVFMFSADDLRYFYVNQGAIEQIGYSRAELLTMTPVDLKPFVSEAQFRELLQPLRHNPRAQHTFETVHRHKNGHHIPVEIALQWVAPDDAPGRYVAVVRDISERRQAEEALRASEQRYRARSLELEETTAMLAERNLELDQFAYITSHDLKAPLRGIANLAQWIEEDLGEELSADVRGHLDLLRGRVVRMEALIDGILEYSRVGRVAREAEPVDVARLLDEIIDLLAPGPQVRISVAPNMPTLLAERLPLQQVFSNLISNAVKHNADRELHVTITAERRGNLMEFAIADDGQGIAPQYHDRIFGIFQTLASRDKVEGSGLGLALVKKIVERQRGKVWIESAEGQGATFRFTWPDRAPREGT